MVKKKGFYYFIFRDIFNQESTILLVNGSEEHNTTLLIATDLGQIGGILDAEESDLHIKNILVWSEFRNMPTQLLISSHIFILLAGNLDSQCAMHSNYLCCFCYERVVGTFEPIF